MIIIKVDSYQLYQKNMKKSEKLKWMSNYQKIYY